LVTAGIGRVTRLPDRSYHAIARSHSAGATRCFSPRPL